MDLFPIESLACAAMPSAGGVRRRGVWPNRGLAVLAALVLVGGWAASQPGVTQKLSSSRPTVYDCIINGRLVYTDEPCPDSSRPDADARSRRGPPSGSDAMRDRSARTGSSGSTAGRVGVPPDAAVKRYRLAPEAQRECASLDARIAEIEALELSVGPLAQAALQQDLRPVRERFRQLGCD